MKHLLRNSLALVCICLCAGCSTPATVTPKPDIRPVATSNQRIQAETKQVKTLTGRTRAVAKAIQTDLNTGKVTEAKAKVVELQRIADEVDQHVVTLEELGKGQQTQIVALGGQIDTAHKNEQAMADWKKANEPVITQVNKYWGLGAFAYGAKVLARHLLILGLILGVAGVVLWFFAPGVIKVVATGFSIIAAFLKRIFIHGNK